MTFDHEKLDVYRVAMEFVGWAFALCERLSGVQRHARDQLLRASRSIVQNIAEGNGKRSTARKYQAQIYRDDPSIATRTHVRIEHVPVDAATVRQADLSAQGGQAIRIVPVP